MVYLSRIYTKTGDDGATALGDGSRVPKDHARVEAIGAVDELNAALGVLQTQQPMPERALLDGVSNDLFDLGADLCVPQAADEALGARLRISADHGAALEAAIDRLNANLPPLSSFVLPGGTPAAAWCHLARTICRRAERRLVTLASQATVNPQALIYLNRLSDLLFVLARVLNGSGAHDVLWIPGKRNRAE